MWKATKISHWSLYISLLKVFFFFFSMFFFFLPLMGRSSSHFLTSPVHSLPHITIMLIYVRWAGYSTTWDFTIKSFPLKLWCSYTRKERKEWSFDKLYWRHFESPGEWPPTSLAVTLLLEEKSDLFYFFNITHFLMCHDVFYLPLSVAKISSRCLHPVNIHSEWQKS